MSVYDNKTKQQADYIINQLKAGKDIPFWAVNIYYNEIKQDAEALEQAQKILQESRQLPLLPM